MADPAQAGLSDPPGAAAQLRRVVFDHALPLWAEAGQRADGAFAEALLPDGRALWARPLRARTQARQIYVFAHAALLGWPGGGLARARAGLEFLLRRGWDESQGGFAAILAPEKSGPPTTYDHAAILFALAWLYRTGGGRRALDWIEKTIAVLDGPLADPVHGGVLDYAGQDHGPRAQDPLMHLFEAMLALHEACPKREWLERARAIHARIEEKFVVRESGFLREVVGFDLSPLPGRAGGRGAPGHHFEWAALLDLCPRPDGGVAPEAARRFFELGRSRGLESRSGLVCESMDAGGGPPAPPGRLWPQSEYLRALAHFGSQAEIARFAARFFKAYLAAAPPGLWRDRPARPGLPLTEAAPASSLYHLMSAWQALAGRQGA